MAIHRRVLDDAGNPMLNSDGTQQTLPVPDFSYTDNGGLAQMVVNAWVDGKYRDALLERAHDGTVTPAAAQLAKTSVAECGLYLKRAVVISEKEYHGHYTVQDPDEIVFVLPNHSRVTPRPGGQHEHLVETARLLMATTPNGI